MSHKNMSDEKRRWIKEMSVNTHEERYQKFKECKRALDDNYVCNFERDIYLDKLRKQFRNLEKRYDILCHQLENLSEQASMSNRYRNRRPKNPSDFNQDEE